MIIGIDGNEANVTQRVGVNEYAYRILWNLQKLQEEGSNKHSLIVYLKEEPKTGMPKESPNFKYKIMPGRGLWILTKLMPYLITNPDKLDVFFSPSHYLPLFCPVPTICSIMDLGYLEFSEQFTKKIFWQLKWWTAISIFISKRIIAISNSTKRDIVRHYPFSKNKVEVVYLGYNKESFGTPTSNEDVRRVKNKYSIVDDYVLYLGTLKPSKNIEGLIDAFAILNSKSLINNYKLVIAGKKGWMFDSIFQKVKNLKLDDKVIFTDFISEEDKPHLIKGAKVFVLPSFWEGFGLDALNAMATGVPVIASNIGSLPEVLGDAGILVESRETNSIAKAIEKVLSMNKTDYNSMIEKGRAQANKFSWKESARKILKTIENVHR
jgi:glycosyltransferase involved in cell wall biosynthesis